MFDNTCKFLAENFPSDFATWLLGKPITLTKLSPKELSLEPSVELVVEYTGLTLDVVQQLQTSQSESKEE
jgi:predicted transposase YdaD